MSALLTIYIAAYERPAELRRLLSSIPAHDDVHIVVSDDSGERHLEQVAVGMATSYSPRNYNLGRDMNLLRSVAVCETPWLWVMGDDDWLLPGALDRVLAAIRRDDTDRIIVYSQEAAWRIPFTGHGTAASMIETMRDDPSLLIAATLCSANIFRTETLDLAEGVRHLDTYYAYAWASIGCERWTILDDPAIGVGTEYANAIPDALWHWQNYLDGLCAHAGVASIPVRAANKWNFVMPGSPMLVK